VFVGLKVSRVLPLNFGSNFITTDKEDGATRHLMEIIHDKYVSLSSVENQAYIDLIQPQKMFDIHLTVVTYQSESNVTTLTRR